MNVHTLANNQIVTSQPITHCLPTEQSWFIWCDR
jgi:hypothetical protein